MNKSKSDVQGVKMKCPNFVQCPLCYGCRAYNSADLVCRICAKNKKKNICNKSIHKDDLIAKFIQRTVYKEEN